ncbi:MAG: hypothetical protein ACOC9E_02320 [Chloroflexota bacterium]
MTENHPNTLADEAAEEIDVEEIMQQIRARILAEQANLPQYGETLVDISGKRFSPEFYEHLYRANLAHNEVGVDLHVTRVSIPLLGPLVESLRRKVHELVLFYVNQVTAQQREVNAHLLQALSLLAKELDAETTAQERESNGT